MHEVKKLDVQGLARIVSGSLLATIVIGIFGAIFISHGIDVNVTADIVGTAENMLQAEVRLRAKAYLGLLMLVLQGLTSVGLYFLLRTVDPMLAGWALFMSLSAAILTLLGTVYAMNAAQIAGNEAVQTLTDEKGRLTLSALQAISDYTSFHLSIVLSSFAMAVFFYLFLKSSFVPKLIAGWGIFASLFVASAVVSRDFVPAIGHNAVTVTFMICNLIAIVALGLYLTVKGVRAS